MVDFSSYATPMDREYGAPSRGDTSTNDVGVGVQDLGWGLPMGIGAQNIQGIAAKIREGAGNLEIQFAGNVTGQRGAQTPGMYGKEQREAMRELAQINEVNLTTHAAFGIMGLAGMDPRSGNFSGEYRKTAVDEIKRAVEFAADAARGGSVVVHTGEFQRPISEQPWAWKDPNDPSKGYVFKGFASEEEEAVIRVVDDRTGQIMTQVRKNERVPRPVWLKNEQGQYINYEGEIINREDRVPEYDEKTGRFKVETKDWSYFKDEAREINLDLARKKGMDVREFEIRHPNEYVYPEEAFLRATLEANEGHARGWALQYSHGFQKQKDLVNTLKKEQEVFQKMESSLKTEEEKSAFMERSRAELERLGVRPEEGKMPSEILNSAIEDTRRNLEYSHEASVSQQQMAEQAKAAKEHVKSASKFALDKSFTSYAEAGIHAFDETRAKHLEKNPVHLSMENIYPEQYGGHPDELKELVINSRERMAEMMSKQKIDGKDNPHYRGVSEKEAKKLADQHIKATLDVGHLNTWRKYWQNDPKKSMRENDSEFKRWFLEKTEDLAKNGIIGNVHLADNYGYQDEHLIPGQGTAPIKEAVGIIKKHGYKGPLTVEAGSAATTDVSDFHGLMKTWKLFGSPVYGAHAPISRTDVPRQSWGDIQYSYFGQRHSPYYIFGGYSPSQDWTLWSQVPME